MDASMAAEAEDSVNGKGDDVGELWGEYSCHGELTLWCIVMWGCSVVGHVIGGQIYVVVYVCCGIFIV